MKNIHRDTKRKSLWQQLFAKAPVFFKKKIRFDENHPMLIKKKEEANNLLAGNQLQSH